MRISNKTATIIGIAIILAVFIYKAPIFAVMIVLQGGCLILIGAILYYAIKGWRAR